MKKIIVFGATGTIGQQLLSQALEQGHKVTAFTRSKEKISIQHKSLHIAEGDVLNPESLVKAIKDQDIVMCALGNGRKGTVRAKGTLNIIQAMQQQGIKRLICQTTLGAGNSVNNLNFFWKRIMFGWFLKAAYEDHQLQEKYIFESGLDWTIIRPGAFADGEVTGQYKHGFSPDEKQIKLKISRADVAHFMLKQIGNSTYLHQTPGLSY